MNMDRGEHRQKTLGFFRNAALNKEGFYDATDANDLRHSIWQRRVRAHIHSRVLHLVDTCDTLVEVGCGNGDFIKELAVELPATKFCGQDFSSDMIDIAKRKYGEKNNLTYQTHDLLNPDPQMGQFDIVLCVNMFHHLHLDDLDRGMDSLAALTGKTLLFEIKNENNFWNRRFRPTEDFPLNLLSPRRARSYLLPKGLQFVHQWNIFGLDFLSPIVILEFSRDQV